MLLEEIILAAIANAVFSYVIESNGGKLENWARDKLGRETTKRAFKEALLVTFRHLKEQHPQWVDEHFDASFFEHEGAPILAQFLIRDGHPDPSELAARWADSLNIQQLEQRSIYTRELEPVAADFLNDLSHQLKSRADLRELNNSRAFEQFNESLQALRQKLGAEKATFGTRRDYLRWLIERNLYLDPRGTFQTQRQVQVKLDNVYVTLQAQRDNAPSTTDRFVLDEELTNFEVMEATADLSAEEIENKHEERQLRLEDTVNTKEPAERLALSQIVTCYDRIVILGDPGSGKTTLLRYLALKHAEALWNGRIEADKELGIARFPLLIRIAEYAEDSTWKRKSLSDFLADSHILHDCPKSGLVDLLQTELENGNCLVLLDGLDEIVSADERLGVVKQIEDFVRHHIRKANRFVVTSRKAGYRNAALTNPFVHYTVQEMNETQMSHFLERWCQAVEDTETPELSVQERRKVAKRETDSIMKAIRASTGVRRLATNPLLLRTLALIHRTGAQLPQKRIELYKLAADTLARTWRTAQGVPETALVKEEYLTPLLSKLAYWLHSNKPTGMATEREVYDVLGEEWARINDLQWNADDPSPKIKEEIKKFLIAVREHTGLFVERAPKRYGFMHLTFEEYYAARYLVARNKVRAKLIRQLLNQIRWQEPILLALGFVGLDYPSEASELVETAILAEGEEAQEQGFTSSPYEDLLCQDYLFSLRCLGDNIPVRPGLLNRLVERLARELLHYTGAAQFRRYRKALEESLNYLEGSKGFSELIQILLPHLGTTDPVVLPRLSMTLVKLSEQSPGVITALVTALHDEDTHVRYGAASSLGQLDREKVTPEVITALVTALHDEDAHVRYGAASSLGRLDKEKVREKVTPEVITALVTALHDEDARIRYGAASSLGTLKQDLSEVIDILREALRYAKEERICAISANLLGKLSHGDETTCETLIYGLLNENNNVSDSCNRALVLLGNRFPATRQLIEAKLVHAIQDPEFVNHNENGPSGHDNAYTGLWLQIVNREIEEN
jgi:NACHT domain/HEAT repeats